jgi:hypothetical protein
MLFILLLAVVSAETFENNTVCDHMMTVNRERNEIYERCWNMVEGLLKDKPLDSEHQCETDYWNMIKKFFTEIREDYGKMTTCLTHEMENFTLPIVYPRPEMKEPCEAGLANNWVSFTMPELEALNVIYNRFDKVMTGFLTFFETGDMLQCFKDILVHIRKCDPVGFCCPLVNECRTELKMPPTSERMTTMVEAMKTFGGRCKPDIHLFDE